MKDATIRSLFWTSYVVLVVGTMAYVGHLVLNHDAERKPDPMAWGPHEKCTNRTVDKVYTVYTCVSEWTEVTGDVP